MKQLSFAMTGFQPKAGKQTRVHEFKFEVQLLITGGAGKIYQMHDFDVANPNGPFNYRFPFRRLSCEKQGGDVRLRALHRQDLRSTDRKARKI